MPRVQVVTDEGKAVGEIPVYVTNVGSARKPRFGHGWDGQTFEQLWTLAQKVEELARQKAELEDDPNPPPGPYIIPPYHICDLTDCPYRTMGKHYHTINVLAEGDAERRINEGARR